MMQKKWQRAGVPRGNVRRRAPTPDEPVLDSALRELPPAQALRMGLLLKLGSLRTVWRMLDSNGSGSLSYTEFADGIERTKVPWKELTGLTRLKDLFALFDVDGDKEVSLVEFLGFPDVDDEPPSSAKGPVPTSTMWKRYINQVKLSPMKCTRKSKWNSQPPLHYELEVEHHHAELEKIAEIARKPDDEIANLKRVHINEIEDKGRRITEKLKILNTYTDNFKTLKEDLTDVTIGSKKDREEAEELEKLQAAKQKFKGMATMEVDPQRALMREATESTKKLEGQGVSHSSKPPGDQIFEYFNEKHLDDEEREFREMTRRYEIPMWDACKIRDYFKSYDEDGSGAIDREEFAMVVKDILCFGKAKNVEIPDKVVDQYFNSADKRRCGEVTFENFLVWSFRNGVFANRGK